MSIEASAMKISGFLYLFILGSNAASVGLGNRTDEREKDAVDKLLAINKNPKRFKQSIILALISHSSIIAITVMLYLAFSQYNPILALIGSLFRTGEGLILISSEIQSLSLLNTSKEYVISNDTEKNPLRISTGRYLDKKNFKFVLALNLLSIGHLSYCVLFLTSGAIINPIIFFGFVASILSVIGTSLVLIKPKIDIFYKIGLILLMLYELIFGIWLLFL